MTAPYKKRAKGGWSGGKAYKEQSNKDERAYEKIEIEEQLEQVPIKTKASSKIKSHKDASRMINKLRWIHKFSGGDIEKLLQGMQYQGDYFHQIKENYYTEAKGLIPKVKELLNQDLPNKILQNARDVLSLFKIET